MKLIAVALVTAIGVAQTPSQIANPSTTPSPGTEASIRRFIDSMQRGQPNYDEMTLGLAAANRAQFSESGPRMQRLGALQSLTFQAKDPHGSDIFDATFDKGRVEFTIAPLTPDGKVAARGWRVLPTAEEDATIRQRILDGKPDPERQILLTRLILGEQNAVIAEEIMSPGLIAAAKQQWPRRMQTVRRLGTFVSLQFLHVDMQGWDVYDATYENGHAIWSVGPLTTDHKLAAVVTR
jgi:hypothetical protein